MKRRNIMKKKNETNEKTNTPAHEVRLGSVRLSVWRNVSDSGAWFNTSISRRFRQDDDWKDSNAFNGVADLALVAEGIAQCRDFILRQDVGEEADEA